jgi:predicted acylesterase/phospholipase RssA
MLAGALAEERMPKRVAITIAGAVSLGSYEAGVMYELLEAFRVHNQAATDPDKKIYIDVITGASAGGMTAAMLGVWLMFFGDAMQGARTNPLYRAWVEKISLGGLVRMGRGDRKWNSLLSSELVASIGTGMLVTPLQRRPPVQQHASLEPGAPLRVGVALTNLSGVDYMLRIEGNDDGGFNYTRSVDQRIFTVFADPAQPLALVDGEGNNHTADWKDLRDAAVACGAFPFAFRPCDLAREQEEYVSQATPPWPGTAAGTTEGVTYVKLSPPCRFTYTDGGVLQNQPLGIAKDLVEASVGTRLSRAATADAARIAHQDADDRLYAFISPNEVRSQAQSLQAEKINLGRIGSQVLRTYVRQAAFHDWIMAEKVNDRIRLLDERAGDLAQALHSGSITNIGEFTRAAANLNDLFLGEGKQAALDRLRNQYETLIDKQLGNDAAMTDAFVNGIAALEASAKLSDKEKMHIFAVLADGRTELAGSGVCSFVGFFSRKFRDHDYMVGRQKAQTYLARADVSGVLGLNLAAVRAEWARKQALGGDDALRDPETIVKLPLTVPRMLAPAIGPVAWMTALRAWPLLVAGAVVVAARRGHWFRR